MSCLWRDKTRINCFYILILALGTFLTACDKQSENHSSEQTNTLSSVLPKPLARLTNLKLSPSNFSVKAIIDGQSYELADLVIDQTNNSLSGKIEGVPKGNRSIQLEYFVNGIRVAISELSDVNVIAGKQNNAEVSLEALKLDDNDGDGFSNLSELDAGTNLNDHNQLPVGSKPNVAPPQAINIEATALDKTVKLSWQLEGVASSFNVYYVKQAQEITNLDKSKLVVFENVDNPFTIPDVLVNKTQYHFYIAAVNDAGESVVHIAATPDAADVTPDTSDGIVPGKPKVTASAGSFSMQWLPVTDANSYSVYMAQEPGVTSTTAKTFTDGMTHTGVVSPFGHAITNGNTYYMVVSATNSENIEGPTSAEISIKPKSAISGVPDKISIEAGEDQITLSWQAVTDAISYNVYWSTSPDVTPKTGQLAPGGSDTTSTTITHSGLQNGLMHFYVVTAILTTGESEESAQVGATPYGQLSKPILNTPEESDKRITLSWAPVAGAVKYTLYMAPDSSLTTENAASLPGSMIHTDIVTNSFDHPGLQNDVTYAFRLTATDKFGKESEQSDLVQAAAHLPANTPPTEQNPIPNQTALVGSELNFQFATNTFSDIDKNALTYAALAAGGALPEWLSFDSATRTFSGIPSTGDINVLTIKIVADDGNGGTAFTQFQLTVTNTLTSPIAVNDSKTLLEGELAIIDVIVNDLQANSPLNSAAVTIKKAATHGTTKVETNGSITYQHDGSESLEDSFSYQVTDSDKKISNEAIVSLTITPQNDPPVISGVPTVSVPRNNTYSFTPQVVDPDVGDTLTFSINKQPSWATFNTSTGKLSGTAATTGTTSGIIISVADGKSPAVALTAFDLTVTSVAPIVSNITPANNSTAKVVALESNIVITFSEPMNTASVESALSFLPGIGTNVKTWSSNDTVLTINPDINLNNNALYEVKIDTTAIDAANNALPAFSSKFHTIDSMPPVANPDLNEKLIAVGNSVTLFVLDNDTDANGTLNTSSISIKTKPKNGSATPNQDGSITYQSTPGGLPEDTFTYTVKDNDGFESNEALVTIRVLPWTSTDIGNVGTAKGSFTFATEQITVIGGGADIWGTSDAFHYVYKPIKGDMEITARITDIQNMFRYTKAGVMIRESITSPLADSKFVNLFVTSRSQNPKLSATEVHVNARATDGGQAFNPNARFNIATVPRYVKLIRRGDTFNSYESVDGNSWKLIATVNIPMKQDVFVGLSLTSHAERKLSTAVFDNITLLNQSIDPPVATDASTLSLDNQTVDTGSAYYRFTGLKISKTYTVGITSNNAEDLNIQVFRDPFNLLECNSFLADVNYDSCLATANTSNELYVRVDGSYTSAGATFSIKLTEWADGLDIGTTTTGYDSETESEFPVKDVYTIGGSGRDIFGTADGFRYFYQNISGDAEIIARVFSQDHTDDWAKAGIMFRETISAGSKFVDVVVTPAAGVRFQSREITDTGNVGHDNTRVNAAPAPRWIRLVRRGDAFDAYESPDESDWLFLGTKHLPMNKNLLLGLAVTAHDGTDTVISEAKFDNVIVNNGSGKSITTDLLPGPISLPQSTAFYVDKTDRYFKVNNLKSSTKYTVEMAGLTDDADLYVYTDEFNTMACPSATVDPVNEEGTTKEVCVVPANSSGELYIRVNGSYTTSGSNFTLTVQ